MSDKKVSSLIKGIVYNHNTSVLTVELNNRSYEYKDVPQKVVDEFRAAESQGSFFNSQIRSSYNFVKL